MEPLTPVLTFLATAPAGMSASLGATAVFILLLLKMRNHGLESVTSISKLQSLQVQELMVQNRELASDLSNLRGKMAAALNDLSDLRGEVATLRHQLRLYELHCSKCERRPECFL